MAEPGADTAATDVRPVVRTASGMSFAPWIFGAFTLLAGAWVFSTMNASRLQDSAPRVGVPQGYGSDRIASPPEIAMPDRFAEAGAGGPANTGGRDFGRLIAIPRPQPARALAPAIAPVIAPPEPPRVIDYPLPPAPPLPSQSSKWGEEESPASAGIVQGTGADRVRAGRLANPALTVPLGTIIPAVLETALDSTRPGGVRALVQRDVRGFDGSRVLIPRGSRLYGEYEADLQRGQNRALIRWTRLLRPDGVTIALDSNASDPLGRAGVKGKVDGKFFQRFGNAILGSALDIGVGLATREATGGVILALPGSSQSISGQNAEEIRPTLKVKHGTSVSVYVGRDLDFSTVDG